jgi:hypothetical protein
MLVCYNTFMKKDKIFYQVSTWAIFLLISLPAIIFINTASTKEVFTHLGFPGYFRIELEIAKFFAGLVLILPLVLAGKRVKEWAYVGLGIDFISALIANYVVDGAMLSGVLVSIVAIILLIVSYKYFHKVKGQ